MALLVESSFTLNIISVSLLNKVQFLTLSQRLESSVVCSHQLQSLVVHRLVLWVVSVLSRTSSGISSVEMALDSINFNIDHGYLEGLVRGFRSGILKQADYLNLVQCETLEGMIIVCR